MEQFTVTFQPGDVRVTVPAGTTLLQAQIQAGLRPDAPCGGRGSCGGGRGFPAGVWWCLRRSGEGSGCDAGFFFFLEVGRRILPGMRYVPDSSCKDMEVFHS